MSSDLDWRLQFMWEALLWGLFLVYLAAVVFVVLLALAWIVNGLIWCVLWFRDRGRR